MREPEMAEVASLIDRVIQAPEDEANLSSVKQGVVELCSRFAVHN